MKCQLTKSHSLWDNRNTVITQFRQISGLDNDYPKKRPQYHATFYEYEAATAEHKFFNN